MADEASGLVLPVLREMRAEAAAFRAETLAAFAEVQAFRAETVAAFAEIHGSLAEVRATQAEHGRRLGEPGVAVSCAVQARAGETVAEVAPGSRLDAMEARLAAGEARLDGRG